MNLTPEQLNDFVENKFDKLIELYLKKHGIVKAWEAIVTEVNGDGTIDVKLATDQTTILSSKKNKTGVILAAGDEVYLHSISSLSNSYVAVCKTK